MNKIYTFDLVPSKNFKNKLIKVNAGSSKEAKEKLLKELNKLNKRFVKVRLVTEQELQ
jgi:soluble P-type ATPase